MLACRTLALATSRTFLSALPPHHQRSSVSRHLLCSISPRSFQITPTQFATALFMSSTQSSAPIGPSETAENNSSELVLPRFRVTPTRGHTEPLGQGKTIQTAACLIIGDEILNGKTRDSNSHYFAKFCFDHGIDLKRIEVIADEEPEIVEAATRMAKIYDFIITCGGIGPTHDDITYASLASAFNLTLKHDSETIHRMTELSKNRDDIANQTEEQKTARNRMALFPNGEKNEVEILHVDEEMWVPVIRIHGKLCVFPGVPRLYERMLEGLKPYLPLPAADTSSFRHMIFTTMPESSIAPYLTSLQSRVRAEGVRVGSYPQVQSGVTVSLIGKHKGRVLELGQEVMEKLEGKVVVAEETPSGSKQ